MGARAGIVVTGTEVLTGRVADRNGPWLAQALGGLGVDVAHVTVCGDRPGDLDAALRFQADQGVDLLITSGGLGPTADDLTLATVARFAGRELRLDTALEARIAAIVGRLTGAAAAGKPAAAPGAPNTGAAGHVEGIRKQAMVPAGAVVLDPVGTAPGVVLPGTPTVLVLPGPPRELQQMWDAAVATPEVAAAIAGSTPLREQVVRMFGLPESGLAATLRDARTGIDGYDALEVVTCLRRGELEIVVRSRPADADVADRLVEWLDRAHPGEVFATDGATVDERVAALLAGRTVATAESCTAGLLAARLADRPGSSAYLLGGVVSYSNDVKEALLDVPAELLARHGAVSEPVAEAMAAGALARFGADVGVGITGIAGPGGATPGKPVGTVCLCVRLGDGSGRTRTVLLPGDRAAVRERSTTVAMHMLRAALGG